MRSYVLATLCFLSPFLSTYAEQISPHNTPNNFIITLESQIHNNITAQQAFTQLIQNAPLVIVKFFVPGCGPCATMKSRFNALAQELHDRILFVDVSFKLFGSLAEQYKVKSVPTLLYFVNGVEKGRQIGLATPAVLRKKIKDYFAL